MSIVVVLVGVNTFEMNSELAGQLASALLLGVTVVGRD